MAHMQWRLRTALLCAALGVKCCFSLTAPIAGRGASRSSKRAAAASEPPATPLPNGATAATRPNLPDLPAEGGIPKKLGAEIPMASPVSYTHLTLPTKRIV